MSSFVKLSAPQRARLQTLAREELHRRARTPSSRNVTVQAKPVDLDKWANDFLGFAAQLDILSKDGPITKLRPNAIQSAFEVSRSGRDIVLKPRQVGLTTWELARDVWYFLTHPGVQVVVVCQSMADDSAIKELADKIDVMFRSLAAAGIVIPGLDDSSTTKWVLPARNASLKIIGAGASAASASKKGRSGKINRLHVTEASLFEFAEITMNAILECVPGTPGTEIVVESTAYGASGWFYESFNDAKKKSSSFKPHFFYWLQQAEYAIALEPDEKIVPENARERAVIKAGGTLEQLKWYRQKVVDKKSADLVDQEYPLDEVTCWLSAGRQFFDRDRVRELRDSAVTPIDTKEVGREGSRGQLRTWKTRADARRYVVIVDPSEGVGGDPGAAVVLDRGTGEHVATLHGQFATHEMARLCAELGKVYWGVVNNVRMPALIVVERNNHGHAVLQGLVREHRYSYIYAGPDKRAGWVNTEPSRAAALGALQEALVAKHWGSPEKESLEEMMKFVVLSSGRAEAAKGAHDDLVLAHAIGWDVVCRAQIEHYVPPGMVA